MTNELDNISGTNFAQARQYDSKNGRFISTDPHWQPYNRISGSFGRFLPNELAIRQSGNLYDYVIGNSLKFIDLTGTDIILPEDPTYQQMILDELNILVGSTGNNPILGTTENGNGDTIVIFVQPPNPNFPQSTQLVDRLVNSEFTTTIVVNTNLVNEVLRMPKI